jgi:hypothetical protein
MGKSACRSAELVLPFRGRIRISPVRARQLVHDDKARLVSKRPFVVELIAKYAKAFMNVTPWSPESGGFTMNGSALQARKADTSPEPRELKPITGSSLKTLRERRGVEISEVCNFYNSGAGCSRQWIAQIESFDFVSGRVGAAYIRAISAAADRQKKIAEATRRVRVELGE